jgi:hypothetical protein
MLSENTHQPSYSERNEWAGDDGSNLLSDQNHHTPSSEKTADFLWGRFVAARRHQIFFSSHNGAANFADAATRFGGSGAHCAGRAILSETPPPLFGAHSAGGGTMRKNPVAAAAAAGRSQVAVHTQCRRTTAQPVFSLFVRRIIARNGSSVRPIEGLRPTSFVICSDKASRHKALKDSALAAVAFAAGMDGWMEMDVCFGALSARCCNEFSKGCCPLLLMRHPFIILFVFYRQPIYMYM